MHKTFRRSFTAAVLTLLLLGVFQTIVPAPRAAAEGFLAVQAAALRARFRHQLEDVSAIPYYHIHATVDLERATVDGELRLRYINTTGRSLSEMVFRLLPNAGTIYGGGSLSVSTVTRGTRALEFQLSDDRTLMRVPLSRPLAPGQTLFLEISFLTRLPVDTRQGYGVLNQTSSLTSLAGWYPMLAVYRDGWLTPDIPRVGDALVADTSLYEVTLSVPAGARVISTGVATRVERTRSQTTWHLVSGPAREFAAAIGVDFREHRTRVDGVTIRFYTLPASRANTSPSVALDTIARSFEVYTARFGPYPFTEFDVVEVPISIGGYEFPGMVYVDDHLRLHGSPADYEFIVAHEVAHQWWYGLVGSDSITEPWLDESLATYSAYVYLEHAGRAGAGQGLLAYWRATYGPRQAHRLPVNSSALDFSSWLTYRSPVYYQGALFLHALRQEISDQAFFLLLQRYLDTYRYRSATTETFLALAETTSCRELDPLFERWFDLDAPVAPAPCTLALSDSRASTAPH